MLHNAVISHDDESHGFHSCWRAGQRTRTQPKNAKLISPSTHASLPSPPTTLHALSHVQFMHWKGRSRSC